MIDLLLLGTGAMIPLPTRWLSSLLVRVDGSLILFDCGEGTQIAMRNHHWGFRKLDAICITHHHADHVAGLPGLFYTVAAAGRTEPLHIWGPPGTIDIVTGLRVIVPGLPYDMIVHEVEGGDQFELPGGLRAEVAWGHHRVPVLGYRIEKPRDPAFDPAKAEALGIPKPLWGRLQKGETVTVEGREITPPMVRGPEREGVSFALTTDTRPTEALVELARGVDLLISEGTYGEDDDADAANEWGHMTYRQAATQAAAAEVGALWLTHFSASMNEPEEYAANARDVFPNTTIGRAGLTGQLIFDEGYREIGG